MGTQDKDGRHRYHQSLEPSVWPTALAYPLAGAIFLGMIAGCGWRALSGRGIRWKGRRY